MGSRFGFGCKAHGPCLSDFVANCGSRGASVAHSRRTGPLDFDFQVIVVPFVSAQPAGHPIMQTADCACGQ
ncbi:hypothetical protein GCM10009792_25110 [Microcella alkalica]